MSFESQHLIHYLQILYKTFFPKIIWKKHLGVSNEELQGLSEYEVKHRYFHLEKSTWLQSDLENFPQG